MRVNVMHKYGKVNEEMMSKKRQIVKKVYDRKEKKKKIQREKCSDQNPNGLILLAKKRLLK